MVLEKNEEFEFGTWSCIGRGVEVYFNRFGFFGSLTLVLILDRLLINFYAEIQQGIFLQYPIPMSIVMLLGTVVGAYLIVIMQVMVLLASEAAMTEAELHIGDLFRDAHEAAWRFFGWSALLAIMYMPFLVVPTLLSGIIGANFWLSESIFLICMFLSLGVHTLFSIAPVMSVIDGTQPNHLRLSRQLIGDFFWQVFWILGLTLFYNHIVQLIQMNPMAVALPSVVQMIFSMLNIIIQCWLFVITLMALYYAYDTIKELNNAEE